MLGLNVDWSDGRSRLYIWVTEDSGFQLKFMRIGSPKWEQLPVTKELAEKLVGAINGALSSRGSGGFTEPGSSCIQFSIKKMLFWRYKFVYESGRENEGTYWVMIIRETKLQQLHRALKLYFAI